jgi:LysR family hydrogen peroxide-inducible transcriptional activator
LLEDGHCLRQQALEGCRLTDQDGLGSTRLATLIELVAVGQGVTLLPLVATASLARDPRLALLEFEAPVPFRTIGLAWRLSSAVAKQLEDVAGLFQQEHHKRHADGGAS